MGSVPETAENEHELCEWFLGQWTMTGLVWPTLCIHNDISEHSRQQPLKFKHAVGENPNCDEQTFICGLQLRSNKSKCAMNWPAGGVRKAFHGVLAWIPLSNCDLLRWNGACVEKTNWERHSNWNYNYAYLTPINSVIGMSREGRPEWMERRGTQLQPHKTNLSASLVWCVWNIANKG